MSIAHVIRRSLHASVRTSGRMPFPKPSEQRVQELAENIKAIRSEMVQATSDKQATLVLVSKLKPPSDLMAAYERLGDDEKHFGENYVQEVSASATVDPALRPY